MKTMARSRALPWIGLLFVLMIAAGLRLWQIETIPPGFHFDESFEGLEAWRILTDPTYRPIFLTGNFGVPPLNAYANAIMFGLFGVLGLEAGPLAMRVTAALFGILGVATVYLLATELRRLDEPAPLVAGSFALWAAAMLAVMRWHIHFSRMGIEPVIVPFIWAGSTWLLLRGWRTNSWPSTIGCALFLAAGMYTYQGAWVVPFVTVVVAALLVEDRRSKIKERAIDGSTSTAPPPALRSSIVHLLATAAIATLLVLPLLRFFLQHPDLLILRPAQLAIVGDTGSPADNAVWQSVWATLKMFGPLGQVGDLDPRRNLPGAPALNLWLAIPFYLGLVIALWRLRRPAFSIPIVGLIGLLLPGFFSEYAPHFHRVLGAAAPVALIGGIGATWLWSWPWLRRRHLHWAMVVLLFMGGLTSARNYFVRWSTLPDLYYAFDTGLWEMAQWVATEPGSTPLYLTPRELSHPTLAFALRDADSPAPISFDGRHIFPVSLGTNASAEHYLVVEHEDFRTPLLLPEVLPSSSVTARFLDRQENVYAQVYTRPAMSEVSRAPGVALGVDLGDGIGLAGYDLLPAPAKAGSILYLQLHWVTDAVPSGDWTVFTHVVDLESGNVLAGRDSQPGNGSLPTSRWQPGWRILDEYQIPLPADLPQGEYGLSIGMYQQDGRRLPTGSDGPESDALSLGTFIVE